MIRNYHTHTYRCKHASGEVIDYALAAHAGGCVALGITDHAPFPHMPWGNVRMDMEELDGYLAAIDAARAACPGMEILPGLECEWVPAFASYIRDTLLAHPGIRYLVGGVHYFLHEGTWFPMDAIDTPPRLRSYARHVDEALRAGCFAFLAHPDTFGQAYLPWDRHAEDAAHVICAAAAETGVPLEINGYGLRKPRVRAPEGVRCPYPLEGFWAVAAGYPITVICNSDAHRPEDVLASIPETRAIAARHGLAEAAPSAFLPPPPSNPFS